MIKSNKFYSIRMFVLLCVALVFSCNNITTLEVIKHSKQKLAVPTHSVDGIEVDYGTDLKFSYKVSDALLFYTTDGSVPEIDDTDSISYNPNNGIKLTESCEITVRLFHSNYEPSDSQTYRFRVRYPLPEFTPEDSVIDSTTPISIKTPVKGGKIYYSIDSTVELNENNGIEYDSDDDPIMLSAGQHLLKAIVINGKQSPKLHKRFILLRIKTVFILIH